MKNNALKDKKNNKIISSILNSKKTYLFLIGIIGFVIFVMSYYTYPTPDDFNYAHIPWTTDALNSLRDIVHSQKLIYFNWSGRILIFTLQQLFSMTNIAVFALANAAVFVALMVFVSKFINKKNSIFTLLLTFSIFWFLTPNFAEDYIWLCGSFNYLWPSLFITLASFYFYKIYIEKKECNKIEKTLSPILIFMGAASHETAAFVLGGFLGCYVIFNFKEFFQLIKNKNINMILSVICFIAGFSLLILSPGNYNRSGDMGSVFYVDNIIRNLSYFKIIGLLMFSMFAYLAYKRENKKIIKYIKCFYLPVIIAVIPMIFVREFPERSTLPYLIFCIIPVIFVINNIYDSLKNKKVKFSILLLIFILTFPSVIKVTNFYITDLKEYDENVEYLIKYNKFNNNDVWVFDTLNMPENIKSSYIMHSIYRNNQFDSSVANIYFCYNFGCKTSRAKNQNNVLLEVLLSEEIDDSVPITLDLLDGRYSYRVLGWGTHPGYEDYNKKRIVFEVPRESVNNLKVILPNNTSLKIESITIMDTGSIKVISHNSIIDHITNCDNCSILKNETYIELNILENSTLEFKL